MHESLIADHIRCSIDAKEQLLADTNIVASIRRAAALCVESLRQGGKVLIAGNGGSAADAQHIAAELVGRYRQDRPALPAIAITTDTSALTAIGNDYGYDQVFSRQVEALARPGDVLIGISTSGNSGNVLNAAQTARGIGASVVGLVGRAGALAEKSDILIEVPAGRTATIQECHIMIGHILCALIETEMFDLPLE